MSIFISCAAGIATIDVYKEENLLQNSKEMGRVLGEELELREAKLAPCQRNHTQVWCFLHLSDARLALRKLMVAFIDELKDM
ncbi:hypothetical protein, partial [Acetomicrobium sp. S15 = DSM 107314]|uniref:hypothetical protein n=1 Tax=Acetomicrobium sp. S15 = DSM 107314 TaxID=2529858 RepID=UPI0018E19123